MTEPDQATEETDVRQSGVLQPTPAGVNRTRLDPSQAFQSPGSVTVPPRVCDTCHDEKMVTVGGHSVNPYTGVLTPDPQESYDVPCPDCQLPPEDE